MLVAASWTGTAYAEGASASASNSRDLALTSGPALSVGVGSQSGGAGGRVSYYFAPADWEVRFGVYFGAGYFPVLQGTPLGFAAGGFAFVGQHHRGLIDVSYSLIETGNILILPPTDDFKLYGLTTAVGYEYMHPGGFFVRLTAGATFGSPTFSHGIVPAGNIALGLKLF